MKILKLFTPLVIDLLGLGIEGCATEAPIPDPSIVSTSPMPAAPEPPKPEPRQISWNAFPQLYNPVSVVVIVRNQGKQPVYICLSPECKRGEGLKVDAGEEYQLQGYDLESGFLRVTK